MRAASEFALTRPLALFLAGWLMAIPGWAKDSSAEVKDKEVDSFSDAFRHGTFKGLFRYSAQYRNSNVLLLQDGSDEALPDVSVRQYSAWGGFAGYQTAPWNGPSPPPISSE